MPEDGSVRNVPLYATCCIHSLRDEYFTEDGEMHVLTRHGAAVALKDASSGRVVTERQVVAVGEHG